MLLRPVYVFLLAGLSFSALSMAGPPSYSVKELGANQYVIGINNRGQVLTWGAVDSAPTYLYGERGEPIDLSALPLLPSECKYHTPARPLTVAAAGLNNRGFVLLNVYGSQDDPAGDDCIVLYHDGSLIHDRTLSATAYATGINDRNQIIGNRGFGPRCDFDRTGSVITADAINDRGQIVGSSTNGIELCTAGVWQVLPKLPGSVAVSASAINNKGEVVGTALVSVDQNSTVSHGFIYSNGQIVDMGTLAGTPNGNTYPESINEQGQVVGAAYTEAGPTTFVYQDGILFDLTRLISADDPLSGLVRLVGDARINEKGVIAANGVDLRTGAAHVYVLTPRPAAMVANARP